MYDHKKQYRCTIIRGKSKKEMDDLLPAYALVIDEICPCKGHRCPVGHSGKLLARRGLETPQEERPGW